MGNLHPELDVLPYAHPAKGAHLAISHRSISMTSYTARRGVRHHPSSIPTALVVVVASWGLWWVLEANIAHAPPGLLSPSEANATTRVPMIGVVRMAMGLPSPVVVVYLPV